MKGFLVISMKDIHKNAVYQAKFYKNDRNYFLSSDINGFVYLVTITKMFFSYSYDKQLLI